MRAVPPELDILMVSPPTQTPARAGATVPAAFLEGWRRALGAPPLAAGLLVLALIAAAVLPGWTLSRADAFLGFGGALATLDRTREIAGWPALIGVAAIHALLWLLLAGGILDRLTRRQRASSAAFLSACRRNALPLLRIVVFLLPFYAVLWYLVRPPLLSPEAGVGRDVLLAMFFLILALTNVVGDFAAVRTVAEDRRSALGSIAASLRFIRRRPWRIAALYASNILAMLLVTRLWLMSSVPATPAFLGLLVWPVYGLLRIWTRLGFLASELAFFQHELGVAQQAVPPDPIWPDAPSTER